MKPCNTIKALVVILTTPGIAMPVVQIDEQSVELPAREMEDTVVIGHADNTDDLPVWAWDEALYTNAVCPCHEDGTVCPRDDDEANYACDEDVADYACDEDVADHACDEDETNYACDEDETTCLTGEEEKVYPIWTREEMITAEPVPTHDQEGDAALLAYAQQVIANYARISARSGGDVWGYMVHDGAPVGRDFFIAMLTRQLDEVVRALQA